MPLPNDIVAEGHEERIQRLEAGVQQVSTQIAEHGIKVGYMAQQIADTRKELGERMDRLSADMGQKLDATCSKIDRVVGKVEKQDQRINDLEENEKSRKQFWVKVKRVVYSLLTVGAGAAITKLVEMWLTSGS